MLVNRGGQHLRPQIAAEFVEPNEHNPTVWEGVSVGEFAEVFVFGQQNRPGLHRQTEDVRVEDSGSGVPDSDHVPTVRTQAVNDRPGYTLIGDEPHATRPGVGEVFTAGKYESNRSERPANRIASSTCSRERNG